MDADQTAALDVIRSFLQEKIFGTRNIRTGPELENLCAQVLKHGFERARQHQCALQDACRQETRETWDDLTKKLNRGDMETAGLLFSFCRDSIRASLYRHFRTVGRFGDLQARHLAEEECEKAGLRVIERLCTHRDVDAPFTPDTYVLRQYFAYVLYEKQYWDRRIAGGQSPVTGRKTDLQDDLCATSFSEMSRGDDGVPFENALAAMHPNPEDVLLATERTYRFLTLIELAAELIEPHKFAVFMLSVCLEESHATIVSTCGPMTLNALHRSIAEEFARLHSEFAPRPDIEKALAPFAAALRQEAPAGMRGPALGDVPLERFFTAQGGEKNCKDWIYRIRQDLRIALNVDPDKPQRPGSGTHGQNARARAKKTALVHAAGHHAP